MKNELTPVQMNFKNEKAMQAYSNSDYIVNTCIFSVMAEDGYYLVTLQDDIVFEGNYEETEQFFADMKSEKYYYMSGHDANEISFEEFDSLQELADKYYNGDADMAMIDTAYVFDQEEYDTWMSEEA